MRTTITVTVAAVVLALLIVAKNKTVAISEATEGQPQNTVSIYGLHVGYPNMKNLPVQEAPMP